MRNEINKMSAKHVIVLFLVQFVLFTHCQQVAKFFRKDYQYIESTETFYKIHTSHRSWEAAKERCEFEGASLFYPKDEDEAMSVLDYWKRTQIFKSIWIGISTPNVKEVFETIDDCQQAAKFFRKDYEYVERTKTFYKFHTIPKTWEAAKERCEFEGATLYYPNDEDEALAVIDYWNRTQSHTLIFIGVSTPNVKEVFETVDGLAISQVYDKWGRGEPNNYEGKEGCVVMRIDDATLHDDLCEKPFSFICKKTLNSLVWNAACDLPDQSYVYNSQGRCYKFHLVPKSWEDAVTICNAEQSYLAVVNSDAEAELLVNITKNAPKDQVEDTDFMNGTVHLGFKFDHRWRTLKGESLLKSGYAKWETGQPDGKGQDECGSMFFNGKLNDIGCSQKCFFICEHEPAILSAEYDFRFGQNNEVTDTVCV